MSFPCHPGIVVPLPGASKLPASKGQELALFCLCSRLGRHSFGFLNQLQSLFFSAIWASFFLIDSNMSPKLNLEFPRQYDHICAGVHWATGYFWHVWMSFYKKTIFKDCVARTRGQSKPMCRFSKMRQDKDRPWWHQESPGALGSFWTLAPDHIPVRTTDMPVYRGGHSSWGWGRGKEGRERSEMSRTDPVGWISQGTVYIIFCLCRGVEGYVCVHGDQRTP